MRILAITLAFPAFVFAHDDFPTEKKVVELLAKTSEHPKVFDHNRAQVFTVYLLSHEKAYVLPVALPNEGRNRMFRMALLRPAINEARVLPSSVKQIDGVYDLNEDLVSELLVSEIYSGQGSMSGTKAVVNLDGWEPVVLLKRDISSNSGMYVPKDAGYFDNQCIWNVSEIENSTILELQEQCHTEKGGRSAQKSSTKRAFRLIKGKLTEVPWISKPGEKKP